MSISEDEFQDEDFFEVIPQKLTAKNMPDITVRLSKPKQNPASTRVVDRRAKAHIAFRRTPAKWIRRNGPRFNVEIGGQSCNLLRIRPAPHGRFEYIETKETPRLQIGHINVWPDVARPASEAEWILSADCTSMLLKLPDDFAVAPETSRKPPLAHGGTASAKPAKAPSSAAPDSTPQKRLTPSSEAKTLASLSVRKEPTRGGMAVPMGEPPPGRSALDQRREGKN